MGAGRAIEWGARGAEERGIAGWAELRENHGCSSTSEEIDGKERRRRKKKNDDDDNMASLPKCETGMRALRAPLTLAARCSRPLGTLAAARVVQCRPCGSQVICYARNWKHFEQHVSVCLSFVVTCVGRMCQLKKFGNILMRVFVLLILSLVCLFSLLFEDIH